MRGQSCCTNLLLCDEITDKTTRLAVRRVIAAYSAHNRERGTKYSDCLDSACAHYIVDRRVIDAYVLQHFERTFEFNDDFSASKACVGNDSSAAECEP